MSESTTKLYRIITFERAVEIFTNREFYFAHPTQWEDPYETRIEHEKSHLFFAQCWSRLALSDALWRIYSPDKLSVRIRIDKEHLIEHLHRTKAVHPFAFKVKRVEYPLKSDLDRKIEVISSNFKRDMKSQTAAEALFLKRHAFKHESEVRVVIYDKSRDPALTLESGFKLPVDPHDIIQSIYFDPRAPKSYVEACSHYFKSKLNFPKKVAQSQLYTKEEKVDQQRKRGL